MDFNIDIRRKQLNSLDQFIKSSRENFDSILKSLSWTEDAVRKEGSMVTCGINPEHKVPSNNLEKHMKECTLRQEDYLESTHLLSEPLHDKLASIHISKDQKLELFTNALKNDKEFEAVWKSDDPDPKSADRIYCTYSSHERRVMYEHCVASTVGPETPPDFNIYKLYKSSTGVPLTADEERAKERDLKRRSFKYKKTYTSRDRDPLQVMREVINGQMELYSEWLTAREKNHTEPSETADRDSEHNHDRKSQRKGPRTPEHEAPSDDGIGACNGNGHHDDMEDYERRDSRQSSRSRGFRRDRSRSPRRPRSSRDEQPHRRRYSSRTRSRTRSRSPRGSSSRYNSTQRRDKDKESDRWRDKRKSYSSRHSDGSDRLRDRSRSRSPRPTRSRR